MSKFELPTTSEDLGALFSELEQLCAEEKLTLETAKPVFQKYGL